MLLVPTFIAMKRIKLPRLNMDWMARMVNSGHKEKISLYPAP